ncbi:spore germination protein [Paenibacillus eucommiae]|uniref:Spore germination protein n=1 Tax=Paenibacillus eucommiae TaxID=1355755 RepID=A0ABS4J269_9BACL|nr:spore germination protein [Paenibacillus eucommiae]MBP1993932.1 spore germination protein [Paenibacillus eucommiae]
MNNSKLAQRHQDILKELPTAIDVRSRCISNGEFEIELVYLTSLCDELNIYKYVIRPFLSCTDVSTLEVILNSLPECQEGGGDKSLSQKMLHSHVIIFVMDQIYVWKANHLFNDQPMESNVEITIQGPQKGLAENNATNLNLIRHEYTSSSLNVQYRYVGEVTQRELMIINDEKYCKPGTLDAVIKSISNIDISMVQSMGQLQKLMLRKKLMLMPTMLITERPDRIAKCLEQGKIVLLMQGMPFALVTPSTFFEQMSAIDDAYNPYWFTALLIMMRYLSVILTITLPGLYVAIISYNPELFRIQLAFTIAGSRAVVPYPSFVEVILMLFMIEALVEGSIRLPKSIGQTATTVGGLILGQAAQQAGLVSSIMIIVTSVVAICNFIIPINALSYSIRFLKYPLILFATFLGLVGLVGGVLIYIILLANYRSFGEPYLQLPIKLRQRGNEGR